MMYRFLKILAILFLLVVAFCLSSWFFFPWEKAGEYALNMVDHRVSSAGAALSWQEVDSRGRIDPVIHVRGLEVRTFAGVVSIPDLMVQPLPSRSVTVMGPAFDVEYSSGIISFTLGGLSPAYETEGSFTVQVRGNTFDLKDIAVDGDVSVRGGLSLDRNSRRLTFADLLLEVPENMESILYSTSSFLPLRKMETGQWRLFTGSDEQ